jgi:hypothetical protein
MRAARGREKRPGAAGGLRGAGPASKRAGKLASLSFFFPIAFTFLKQANTIEFKPGFESKHPKTMHRHECNTHNYLFNLEKTNRGFFFPILYFL